MKKLRLGVIGCGDITQFILIMAKLNRKIQIVACTDKQIDRAEKYAKFFKGAKAFSEYQDMVNTVVMDAVYLAVPHFLHYPIMKSLIEKGLYVLCEKPITTTVEDANEIVALAEAKGVKVGVDYQYRYDKACYRMAMAARNNELGKLNYGICNIPWHRENSYFENSKWHKQIETAGGGTLLTQGSHALDVLLWAFNDKPIKATGVTRKYAFPDVEVEDTAIGYIELESGGIITITSSMAAPTEQPITIDLYGSKGSAHYISGFFPKLKIKGTKINSYTSKARGIHALARSLDAYADWVLYDTPYLCTAKDSITVLACILAIYKAARTGNAEYIE